MREKIDEFISVLKAEIQSEELTREGARVEKELDKLIEESKRLTEKESRESVKGLLKREAEVLAEIKMAIQALRVRKILNKVIKGEHVKNASEEEIELISKLTELFGKEGGKCKVVAAVALEDIPAFIGLAGDEYGPFKRGDIIKIREEDLEILINKGLVKVFD